MKKIICLLLALLMSLTLFSACGKKNTKDNEKKNSISDDVDEDEEIEEDEDEDEDMPEYVIIADGERIKGKSSAKTVGDCLEEAGIELGEDDRVSPKKSKEMKDGIEITVKRVTKKQITETAYIPYPTEAKYSDELKSGKSEVTRSGENGTKSVTYEITIVDGKEESREIVSEEIIKAPVAQIVTYGTKKAEKTTEEKTTKKKAEETTKKPPKPTEEPATEESTTKKQTEPTTKKETESTTKKQTEPSTTKKQTEPSTTKKQTEPSTERTTERYVVKEEPVYDCDGSGHGYKIITYSDGCTEYQDF